MTVRFPYSPARVPPIPAIVATLWSPAGARSIPGLSAHIDTAADRTLVPLHHPQPLGLRPTRRLTVHALGSVRHTLDVYSLGVEISGVAVISTRVITHPDEQVVLLGREILNLFRVTFGAPNQVVEFG